MPPATSQLGLLLLASVLLSVTALSWKRRRMYVYRTPKLYYAFSPPSHPSHLPSPFPIHRGGKWAATNLAHLRDFVVEEVLSDEVAPSPDGYTVFLGHFTWQGPEEKALIKLRPQQLPATDKAGTTTAATAAAAAMSKTPTSLRRLLSYMALQVHLESGAEYGYYHGSVSPLNLTLLRVPLAYHIEVIAPASARQITRARVEERVLVRETAELYQQALGPLAAEIRKDGRSIQWVYNILDHKKEVDRIIFEDLPSSLPPSTFSSPTSGFLLVPDPKWKSHPNPSDTPKEEWKHHPCTAGLACLAIVHDRDIGSLRDLRRTHVPLLKSVLEKGLKAIEEVYGVGREEVRVFVHYVPQFFHFHGKEGGEDGRKRGVEEGNIYVYHCVISYILSFLVFIFYLPGINFPPSFPTITTHSTLLPPQPRIRHRGRTGPPLVRYHRQNRERAARQRVLRTSLHFVLGEEERRALQTIERSRGIVVREMNYEKKELMFSFCRLLSQGSFFCFG
jgi:m7GpppX diphosphatase